MNRLLITLLLFATCVSSFSQVVTTRKTEYDGFQWIQLQNTGVIGINQGARSVEGKDIVPLYKGYKLVSYVYDQKHEGYFEVTSKDNFRGVYSKTGQEIIPVSKGYASICGEPYGPYYVVSKNGYVGICDMAGKEIVPTSRGYTSVFFNSENRHKGYFTVYKGTKTGICDMSGAEIIPCSYNCVIFGMDKYANRYFKYQKSENEFIDLPLTLDENGIAKPYTLQPDQKKTQEDMIESMTPEEREKFMLLFLLLQSQGL